MHAEPSPSASLLDDTVGAATVAGAALRLHGAGRAGPSRVRLDDGERVWIWKVPVSLTADGRVTLTVPPSQRGRARLLFAANRTRSFASAARTTRFNACAADHPLFSGPGTVGPITGWAGSLVTRDRRMCLRLTASAGGRRQAMRVSLGRACR
jgi:hypothetical protein